MQIPVTGTDVWYYYICKREVWLLKRGIEPDQEDDHIQIGRFLHEYYYSRDKKEFDIGSGKMDKLKKINNQYVVQEVKKSSRYLESAKKQLLFYLYQLKKAGIDAIGEIQIPEERKKVKVVLNEQEVHELHHAIEDIQKIAVRSVPPDPKKIKYCKSCAYREYCWA